MIALSYHYFFEKKLYKYCVLVVTVVLFYPNKKIYTSRDFKGGMKNDY